MPGRDVDTALRIAHDLTQSVWLGGALMGAVAIDAAASGAPDPQARTRAVDRAWSRWHRISTPAILAHLAAGTGLVVANRGRQTVQSGALRTTLVRTALTGTALVTEASARRLGRRVAERPVPAHAPTDPVDEVHESAAALRRKLAVAQWTNVAATAAMVAVGARMGEQQRPRELVRGIAARLGIAA